MEDYNNISFEDLLQGLQLAELAGAVPADANNSNQPAWLPALGEGGYGELDVFGLHTGPATPGAPSPCSSSPRGGSTGRAQGQQCQRHNFPAQLQLTDEQLRDMSFTDLENLMAALSLTPAEVAVVKDARRRLKNRRSAHTSSSRRTERTGRLQAVNADLCARLEAAAADHAALTQHVLVLQEENTALKQQAMVHAQERAVLQHEVARLRELLGQ